MLKAAKVFRFLSFFGFIAAACSVQQANATAVKLTFGVVPQQAASQLAKNWGPLFQHLSQSLETNIQFATAKDIPTFEACLAAGAYDLAYMNPYHYTSFSETKGYRAFARQAKKKLKGILVVRNDSAIDELSDLDGTTLAFPSPAAFGASVIPRAVLRGEGYEFEAQYVRSHDSVYRSVASGIFPAGGGVLRTYGNIPDDLRGQLRILYETEAYTPHAFASHPELDETVVEQLRDAMMDVARSNPALLEPLGMKGIEAGADSDWDDVRALGLNVAHTEIVLDDSLKCHSD